MDDNEIAKLAAQALVDKIDQARELVDALVAHHDDLQASEHLDALYEAIEDLKNSLANLETADAAVESAADAAAPILEVHVTGPDGRVTVHRPGVPRNDDGAGS